MIDAGRGELVRMPVLEKATVLAASSLFAGRAIALLTRNAKGAQFVVLHPTRGLLHQIPIPQPRCWAIAENRGVALLLVDEEVISVDLRYGRIHERHAVPAAIKELALDADGQFVAFLGVHDDADQAPLVHTPYTEFIAAARRVSPVVVSVGEPGTDHPSRDGSHGDGSGDYAGNSGNGERDSNGATSDTSVSARPDAADAPILMDEPVASSPPVIVPDLLSYAFGTDPADADHLALRRAAVHPSARAHRRHDPRNRAARGACDRRGVEHRFPLSGGYIRNSAIRAAFLAAQEARGRHRSRKGPSSSRVWSRLPMTRCSCR